ncbi:hypothetical protein H4O18_02795 [Arenibacter sp. BSSL-BM3]|uniref:O-antigen ligase family protein n=1 Tax=Arenibacter arenosicollis TaxID=2762274 RepID=A0ABR7QI96_9FLAO|nr:hypothetical protein [Arenibacter arenosicollis]MBC8766911.1 hypothetical protein [Arenibacter arenosicollis]
MKILLTLKFILASLLITISLNFILIDGIGNVYLSTIVIFLSFIVLFFLSKGVLVTKTYSLLALFLFLFLSLTTGINIIFDKFILAQEQSVFTIIYLQNILAFVIAYYLIEKVSLDFFYKFFLWVVFIATIRIFFEEIEHVFSFSEARGQRIEALFAGGVNNFALIVGLALIISFYTIKNRYLKVGLCLYWFVIIILTMSRGALLGIIFTLFILGLYDTNKKTLSLLLRTSFIITLLGVFAIYYFDKSDLVKAQLENRFLSVFTGDSSIESASSGRGIILSDIYNSHIKGSSLFEYLFGHGMGSIDFTINKADYKSSHNLIVDLFFRNGLLFTLFYIQLFLYLLLKFLSNRAKSNLILFGIFVFLHFELLFNPFVFAAQTGWIYTFFLALFLITFKKTRTDLIQPSGTSN